MSDQRLVDTLWSEAEAARQLGVSKSTVQRLRRREQLPVVWLGRKPMYSPRAVKAQLGL